MYKVEGSNSTFRNCLPVCWLLHLEGRYIFHTATLWVPSEMDVVKMIKCQVNGPNQVGVLSERSLWPHLWATKNATNQLLTVRICPGVYIYIYIIYIYTYMYTHPYLQWFVVPSQQRTALESRKRTKTWKHTIYKYICKKTRGSEQGAV